MRHLGGGTQMECVLPRDDIGSSPIGSRSKDASLRKAETSLAAYQLAIQI
jgi:hypothetical protein